MINQMSGFNQIKATLERLCSSYPIIHCYIQYFVCSGKSNWSFRVLPFFLFVSSWCGTWIKISVEKLEEWQVPGTWYCYLETSRTIFCLTLNLHFLLFWLSQRNSVLHESIWQVWLCWHSLIFKTHFFTCNQTLKSPEQCAQTDSSAGSADSVFVRRDSFLCICTALVGLLTPLEGWYTGLCQSLLKVFIFGHSTKERPLWLSCFLEDKKEPDKEFSVSLPGISWAVYNSH